jgi:large subunit ribosomal protein L4
MRRLALISALAARAESGDVIVIEQFAFVEPKTKIIAGLLRAMEAEKSVLLVTDDRQLLLERVTKNLSRVDCALADKLNPYNLMAVEKIVFTVGALDRLGEVLIDA